MKSNVKSEETRARIFNAAIELFRRKGFEEATMREIATEAGVATGSPRRSASAVCGLNVCTSSTSLLPHFNITSRRVMVLSGVDRR